MRKTSYRIQQLTAAICVIVILSNLAAGILYSYKYFDDNPNDQGGICFFHNIINPCEHYDQIFKIAFIKYKNLMMRSDSHCAFHSEPANIVKEIAVPSLNLKLKSYSKIICLVNSKDSKLVLDRYYSVFHPPKAEIISPV